MYPFYLIGLLHLLLIPLHVPQVQGGLSSRQFQNAVMLRAFVMLFSQAFSLLECHNCLTPVSINDVAFPLNG